MSYDKPNCTTFLSPSIISYNYIEKIKENFCISFNARKPSDSILILKCVSDLSS
jgi:hypothetical protein